MVSKRPKPGDRVCSREGCVNLARPGRWYCAQCCRENDRRNGRKRRKQLRLLMKWAREKGLEVRSNALVRKR